MSTEQDADALLDDAGAQIAQLVAEDGLEDPVDDVADDVTLDEEETAAEPAAEVDPVEVSEMERARKAGWRPLDEYKGDPKQWKDYKEFNEVGDRIVSKLNSKIDKQEAMIKQLVKAQGQVFKQAQEDAIKKLKAQRREAIELGDADTVEDLDLQIEEAKAKKVDLDVEEDNVPQRDPEVTAFIEDEASWFDPAGKRNPDMYNYAVAVEQMERQLNPHADSGAIMAAVKEAVVRRFPGRVPTAKPVAPQKPRQLKHSPVEGGTATVKSAGVMRFSDLPLEAQRIAAQFEKDGIMDRKTYLKQFNEGMS